MRVAFLGTARFGGNQLEALTVDAAAPGPAAAAAFMVHRERAS